MNESITDVWVLIERNRFIQAKQLLQQQLAQTPDNPEVFHAASYIALQTEEIKEGMDLVRQGLALSPDHQGLRYNQHYLLIESEQYAEAEEVILGLLQKNPADVDYLVSYGNLMLKFLIIPKARGLTDEALRLSPNNQRARILNYFLSICEGKQLPADEELGNLIKEDPQSQRLMALLVDSLVEKHRYHDAESIVHELIRISPDELNYIEMAIGLRQRTHWSSWVLWPINRFSWLGSIGMCIIAIFISDYFFDHENHLLKPIGAIIFALYLLWLVYAWVQPPILKRWLIKRGL